MKAIKHRIYLQKDTRTWSYASISLRYTDLRSTNPTNFSNLPDQPTNNRYRRFYGDASLIF